MRTTAELDLDGVPELAAEHIRAGREADGSGQPEQARAHYENALRLLAGSGRTALAGSLYRWIAWTHANAGDPEAALDCLLVAEAAAEAAKDDRGLASVLNTRAGTLFNLGELDEATELFRRVRALATRIGDRKLKAMADQNLGSVASIRGDLRRALRRFRFSLAGYEALGLIHYVGPILNNIGRLQIELQEDKDAEATLLRAKDVCTQRADRHHLIVVQANRARLMLRKGDIVQALAACDEARGLIQSTGDDRWMAEVLLVTGSAHARLGKPELALDSFGRAASVARERKDAKVLADVVLEQGGVFRELGRNRETLLCLNEAHGIFRRLRARRELADAETRITALEDVFLEITRNWGASIESYDAYTQGHSSRVAELACLIASEAGMPESEITWFRMGGLLHDVGKVGVPDAVLNKKGALDEAEWRLMARHPVIGVEMLEGVEFPWDVRPMIRHHHERWDGTGYPDCLRGESIPYSARLLTIADVYDALTTDRPYRKGFDHGAAMAIMEAQQGTLLDPALFPLFRDRVAPKLMTLGSQGGAQVQMLGGSGAAPVKIARRTEVAAAA
jgi:putative nucleotidyltransferase with HDIG domain